MSDCENEVCEIVLRQPDYESYISLKYEYCTVPVRFYQAHCSGLKRVYE